MSDQMPDFLACGEAPFRTPLTADVGWLRAQGRRTETFDDLCNRVARIRLLEATGCLPADEETRRGAERTEVAALCRLALDPARSVRAHQVKSRLFESVGEGRQDNLSALLVASLDVDAARLAAENPIPSTMTAGRPHRYESYIGSQQWRSSPARQLELLMSGHRCRICDRGEPEVGVEVHHRSYVRLGCERASDLCTLCRECHQVATAELRRRRFATRTIPKPADTPRMTPSVPFRDATMHVGRRRNG